AAADADVPRALQSHALYLLCVSAGERIPGHPADPRRSDGAAPASARGGARGRPDHPPFRGSAAVVDAGGGGGTFGAAGGGGGGGGRCGAWGGGGGGGRRGGCGRNALPPPPAPRPRARAPRALGAALRRALPHGAPELYREGTSHILGQPEFREIEKVEPLI